MSQSVQFNALSQSASVDADKGIIYGVCVMSKGEAKGHGLMLDDESLSSFLKLAESRPNGVGTRFGADHDAGADDFNGTLKNFRLDGDKIRADLHLLKSDKNYLKLIEMAQTMPHEFGLSASTTADEVKVGKDKCVRFTEVICVDVVTNPAATKGLFFSTKSNNMKNIALALGLPETATEAEIEQAAKLAFEAKCMSDKDKEKKKKDVDADDEEKGKQGKKFDELLERLTKLEAAEQERNKQVELAAQAAHKAEIENLKLEASKEGKVISLTDEALLKLSIAEVKEHISKLEKGKVNLGGKEHKAEAKGFDAEAAKALRSNGALALGQLMSKQLKLN